MTYNGGKGGAGVYQQIINQLPPHEVYIEAFLGAGAVLRAKRLAAHSYGIERDQAVIDSHWRNGLPGLTVVCDDATRWLRAYPWAGGEVVYCDPPYLMETRSCQRALYGCEFATVEEHRALLTLLKQLPCPVALSGYWSALYAAELASWRSITFQTVKRSGELTTEWLWMNYPAPLELHDYRYLGQDFRERERIKRKRERWKARLRSLPELERHALFAAIAEVRAEQRPPSPEVTMASAIARSDDAADGIAGSEE